MDLNLKKDGNLWGAAVLVIYVAAMGTLLYLYWKDSKTENERWGDVRSKLVDGLGFATVPAQTPNGKHYGHLATDLLENRGADSIAESGREGSASD